MDFLPSQSGFKSCAPGLKWRFRLRTQDIDSKERAGSPADHSEAADGIYCLFNRME
jgi:hypothetical protein